MAIIAFSFVKSPLVAPSHFSLQSTIRTKSRRRHLNFFVEIEIFRGYREPILAILANSCFGRHIFQLIIAPLLSSYYPNLIYQLVMSGCCGENVVLYAAFLNNSSSASSAEPPFAAALFFSCLSISAFAFRIASRNRSLSQASLVISRRSIPKNFS